MRYPIPTDILDQNIAILGKTRSGKSSALRSIIEPMQEDGMPACIIDPKGDWWGLKLSSNGKKAGYPFVIFGGRHADVPINALSGAHVAELVATGNRPCIVDLRGWRPVDRSRFFCEFCSTLLDKNVGNKWIVIDECHNFAPKGKVLSPQAGEMLHWAMRLASEGLGIGLHSMWSSQRPQKVHNDILTSCETLVAMRAIHKADRDAYEDWIDGCGDPTKSVEMLKNIALLKRGTGYVWSPEIGFGPEFVTFPMFSTYDSFKPQTAGETSKLTGWADVNLDDVRAKFANVIQEAEANDPKKLRERIAELERAQRPSNTKLLSDLSTKLEGDFEAKNKLAQAESYRDGYSAGFKKACALVEDNTRDINRRFTSTIKELESGFTVHCQQIAKIAGSIGQHLPRVSPSKNSNELLPHKETSKIFVEEFAMAQEKREAEHRHFGLSPSARKIVNTIHNSHPVSLSFATAARRAGISNRSSAYGKYQKEVFNCTELAYDDDTARYRSLNGDSVVRYDSGADPIEEWISKLPPSYGNMLRVIANKESPLKKHDIAERAGVSPTSSGLASGLRELLSLELIEERDGFYVLAEGLSR